jgi:predicted cupin superfamily sugar epimerase
MRNQVSYSADEIIKLLGLTNHPTCGFYKQTYKSKDTVPEGILRPSFRGKRPLGSVLYFMITADVPMQLHRVPADQMYHHYMGDMVEVLLLYPDGRGEVAQIGSDLRTGNGPQLLIPGGTYHISRLRRDKGVGFALLGTTEWGGVEPGELEIGDMERLVKAYPDLADQIRSFTG